MILLFVTLVFIALIGGLVTWREEIVYQRGVTAGRDALERELSESKVVRKLSIVADTDPR